MLGAADYLLTVATSVGASGLLSAGLVWLGKSWISERLKTSIQHEYDLKLEAYKGVLRAEQETALERLRADNAQFASMLSSASSAFSAAQVAAHQERLSAVKALWAKVIFLRRNTHPIANISDVFGEAEFRNHLTRTSVGKKLLDDLTPDPKALSFDEKTELEELRPFLGEPIYQLFNLYWFLPARIVGEVMADKALMKSDFKFWTTLPDVQKILKDLLTADELTELSTTHMKLMYVRDKIEQRMLALTADLISGKAASADALSNSERMAQLVAESRERMNSKPL